MNVEHHHVLQRTRRHFFEDCRLGLGTLALGSMLTGRAGYGKPVEGRETNPLSMRQPHFAPRATNVIFLFQAGGPSQLELFDEKPRLKELSGQVIPESFVAGKRFAFLPKDAKLLGTARKFRRYGQCGMNLSDVIPHMASIADEICLIKSMKTDVFNHGPAKLFVNTGSPQFSGRPSMGSWVTYGIGSESQDLPGFVVLQSGPRGPRGGSPLWGSGFLPSAYQGVPFLSGADPILNLSSPKGFSGQPQDEFVRAVTDLNALRLEATHDPEIAARIAAYEMAYRMQSSAPSLMDLAGETQQTLADYGCDPGQPSFARNCLLARRMVERGVRFVQLYHTDWDHHGNPGTDLAKSLDDRCGEVDQASAALVKDLKQRGLLENTLVIWGGEFGRTPQGEVRGDLPGRDHHIEAYSMWLAGGGVKAGFTIGESDEIGYETIVDRVHVHDLQATVLHLLGLDHKQLTFRFQGRDFRLTDVHGEVVHKIIA